MSQPTITPASLRNALQAAVDHLDEVEVLLDADRFTTTAKPLKDSLAAFVVGLSAATRVQPSEVQRLLPGWLKAFDENATPMRTRCQRLLSAGITRRTTGEKPAVWKKRLLVEILNKDKAQAEKLIEEFSKPAPSKEPDPIGILALDADIRKFRRQWGELSFSDFEQSLRATAHDIVAKVAKAEGIKSWNQNPTTAAKKKLHKACITFAKNTVTTDVTGGES